MAGEGTLELVVTTRKSSVRAEVLMRTRGLYDVTFVPQEKIPHYINITFNEEDVPGSPFKLDIKDRMAKNNSHLRNGSLVKQVTTNGLVGSVNFALIETKEDNLEVKVLGKFLISTLFSPILIGLITCFRTSKVTHFIQNLS